MVVELIGAGAVVSLGRVGLAGNGEEVVVTGGKDAVVGRGVGVG